MGLAEESGPKGREGLAEGVSPRKEMSLSSIVRPRGGERARRVPLAGKPPVSLPSDALADKPPVAPGAIAGI